MFIFIYKKVKLLLYKKRLKLLLFKNLKFQLISTYIQIIMFCAEHIEYLLNEFLPIRVLCYPNLRSPSSFSLEN
jgi:hypothetical protein